MGLDHEGDHTPVVIGSGRIVPPLLGGAIQGDSPAIDSTVGGSEYEKTVLIKPNHTRISARTRGNDMSFAPLPASSICRKVEKTTEFRMGRN